MDKSKSKILIYSSLAVAGSINTSCREETPYPLAEQPNVLLVVVDDFGWGHFAPNIDQYNQGELNQGVVQVAKKMNYSSDQAQRMAERALPTLTKLSNNGIRFTDAYVTSNVSSPSRAGLITSSYQERFGFYNLDDGAGSIDINVTTMPKLMQNQGYATGSFGKVHYLPQGKQQGTFQDNLTPKEMGFDYYFGYNFNSCPYFESKILYNNSGKVTPDPNYYLTDQITDETISFINNNKDKPKLLYVAYNAVHEPLSRKAPDEYYNHFTEGTDSLKNFFAYVYAFDQGIGRIMNKLDEIGQLDNTIIIFLSDNGAAAPHQGTPWQSHSPLPSNGPYNGFKGETWLGGIKTPMVVSWGRKIKRGSICNTMVSSMDLFPTIFEAAKIKRGFSTQPIDGKSLMPIINGNNAYSPHKELIWMCQQGDFFTLNPTDENPSYAYASFIVRRDNWVLRYLLDGDRYELYDIVSDKGQKNNIANQHPELVSSMTKSFKDWYKGMKNPSGWDGIYWEGLNDKFK